MSRLFHVSEGIYICVKLTDTCVAPNVAEIMWIMPAIGLETNSSIVRKPDIASKIFVDFRKTSTESPGHISISNELLVKKCRLLIGGPHNRRLTRFFLLPLIPV
jgi:hypothetical protein